MSYKKPVVIVQEEKNMATQCPHENACNGKSKHN